MGVGGGGEEGVGVMGRSGIGGWRYGGTEKGVGTEVMIGWGKKIKNNKKREDREKNRRILLLFLHPETQSLQDLPRVLFMLSLYLSPKRRIFLPLFFLFLLFSFSLSFFTWIDSREFTLFQ